LLLHGRERRELELVDQPRYRLRIRSDRIARESPQLVRHALQGAQLFGRQPLPAHAIRQIQHTLAQLATLAAVQKQGQGSAPRTAVPSGEGAEYREAVAEYYRRLGGS
jgi:hypothetical protein